MAEIRVDNLRKTFGEFVAVQDSSFVIEDGEFFVMLGPSGCGKTTTLRMIAGLESITSGDVFIGDNLSNMIIEESSDFDGSTSDDGELNDENEPDIEKHSSNIFNSKQLTDQRFIKIFQIK